LCFLSSLGEPGKESNAHLADELERARTTVAPAKTAHLLDPEKTQRARANARTLLTSSHAHAPYMVL